MKRIGIDCRFSGGFSGLGSHTRGLVSALVPKMQEHTLVLFVRSANEPWLLKIQKEKNVEVVVADFPHYSISELTDFLKTIHKSDLDLFVALHFNVPLGLKVPFVCTVHDLILHQFPNHAPFIKHLAYKFLLARSIARAKKIFTISNAAKKDLIAHYPKAASKIHVVYPGIGSLFKPTGVLDQESMKNRYGLIRPYLLYVGNNKQHKNVEVLIRSFLAANIGETDLVLTCEKPAGIEDNPRIKFVSGISNEELPLFYGASLGTVTATLAEGFCFPPIEAMACNSPALASNIGPIPEVCDGHATLCSPIEKEFTTAIEKFMNDSSLRSKEKLDEARAFSSRYSWDASATMMSSLLLDLL